MAALGEVVARLQATAAKLATTAKSPIQLSELNEVTIPECANGDSASLCDGWAKAAVVLDGNILGLKRDCDALEEVVSSVDEVLEGMDMIKQAKEQGQMQEVSVALHSSCLFTSGIYRPLCDSFEGSCTLGAQTWYISNTDDGCLTEDAV